MTLSQIASFVTTKLSLTDTDSVAAAKQFINARYRMIWESALWTETLGVASKAVAAGDQTVTLSDAPSITFFQSAVAPSTVLDKVVAIKFTETGQDEGLEVANKDWVGYFQLDPNAWIDVSSRRGNPEGFIRLPKDGSGYERLKLVPVPQAAGSLYVLGKLKWVELADSDSPCISGVDNALIAYAEGDMLERSRQYGKAQVKFSEAAAHVGTMKDLEKGQQQSISRIIPDTGAYYDTVCSPE